MSTGTCGDSGASGIARIEAGIDWVTLIADTRREADELATVLDELARLEAAAGAPIKPFRFMGYEGQMCGGARLGFKGQSAVAQLSGELCNASWSRLPSTSGRVTRLDVQTTVELSKSRTEFARSSLRTSPEGRRRFQQSPPRIAYSSDTSGLAIGTVGSRTSYRYARVYDKGVEKRTAPPGKLWRIELETKQHLAPELWRTLRQTEDVPAWCLSTCESHWKSWGLRWPLPASSDLPAPTTAPRREPAPAHTLAAWLGSSVAPVIPRVLTMYTVAELLEILGISHLAAPVTGGTDSAQP